MPDLGGNTLEIVELDTVDGSDPIRLTLSGRDAPLGGRGTGGAFEITPVMRQSEYYNPGADEPTRHVMGNKWEPQTFTGNLQDRFGGQGHARTMAETIVALVTRKRRLKVSWSTWSFFGLMDRAKVSPETPADYNYEITVNIDRPAEDITTVAVSDVDTLPADLAQSTSDQLTRLQTAAEQVAPPTTRGPLPPGDTIAKTDLGMALSAGASVVYEALLIAIAALQALDTILVGLDDPRTLTQSDLGRVISVGAAAMATSANARLTLSSVDLVDADRRWQTSSAWQRMRSDLIEESHLFESMALATTQRLEAMRASGVVDEVYYAVDGDTLESVALARLGDSGRAGDIARRNGLTSFRLTSGQRLILPPRA